jgi:hypothetical protein
MSKFRGIFEKLARQILSNFGEIFLANLEKLFFK